MQTQRAQTTTHSKTSYVRDAQGNIMASYSRSGSVEASLDELYLYGSSRLGSYSPTDNIRHYELTNHLGNVLTVINDRIDATTNKPQVEKATAYEPFGRAISGLEYNRNSTLKYKFGFNGQLRSPELGSGMYTAQFWEYDSRLGRRWNLDPKPTMGYSDYACFLDNPIVFSDPEGDCPWCVGAIVGATIDAGLQLTEIALDDNKSIDDFSWTSVAVSAASGAIGVGIATKIDKAIKVASIASKAATTTIKITTSAATDAATSAGGQMVKKGKVDADEVIVDVVAGGTAGKVAGDLAKKAAKKSPIGKVLTNQANRAERVAANSTRPTRQAAAKSATEKATNYAEKRGAAAGTAASNSTSEAVKEFTKNDDQQIIMRKN